MSMTQGEAMVTAVLRKAMKGDIACAKFVHSELGVNLASDSSSRPPMQVTQADIACLQSHADWISLIEAAHNELRDHEVLDDADATD